MCTCRAGRHVVVFLERGPLYLVAVAATGEPVSVLRLQLHLLHAQITCILTDGFRRMFARNPRYDSRRLLGEPQPYPVAMSFIMTCLAAPKWTRGDFAS